MTGAQVRVADTLLRGTGGRTVLLRMPAPAVAGDDGEQMGLATPQFQDVELGPVTFRRLAATAGPDGLEYQMLVSASAVLAVVGTLAYESAEVLFQSAAGVLMDEVMLRIQSAIAMQNGGATYLYQLRLLGPMALAL